MKDCIRIRNTQEIEPELKHSENPYVLPDNYNYSGNKFDIIEMSNYEYYYDETNRTKLNHRLDTYPTIGFNYLKSGVLSKSIPEIYLKEYNRSVFISNMDRLIIRLIESVKTIKKFSNIYINDYFKTFN